MAHVHNYSHGTEHARIRVFRAGAPEKVEDGGDVELLPASASGLGFTVASGGEYWIQIEASSDYVISTVSFEKLNGTVFTPFITYSPSDFAVFEEGVRIR